MKLRRVLVAAVLGSLSLCSAGIAEDKVKALMLTQSMTFRHDPVKRQPTNLAPAEVAMTQLGQQTGLFEVHCSQDAAADFTKENLDKHDLVIFYTQGNVPIAETDLEYFINVWLKKKGHAFVGFHSALDTLCDYEPYWDMIGGSFNGHPWNAGETVTITVHDTKNPAMKPFGNEFQIKDEIYWYTHWQPEKVHVLMSLNLEKCQTKGEKKNNGLEVRHVPVSWIKNFGDGKVFVTNLGHNESTWVDKRFLEHTTGGIRWALGKESADATPNPELSKQQEAKARKDTGVDK